MDNEDIDALLNAVEEPVLLINDGWTIVAVNASAQEVFGTGLIGGQLARALRNPEAIGAVSTVLAGRTRTQTDFTISEPQPVLYRMTVATLGGSDSRNATIVIALRDISSVQAAQQMRSDFVANVSHELRSPLTTLAGLIETLGGSAKDDPEAQKRFLEIMAREAARMDRLIDDLLSLSRVEADERIRPTELVDVLKVIEPVIAIIREREEASDREIVFKPEFETCPVAGDQDQLTQVFQNLLENAVKYSSPGGKVTVSVERRKPMPKFASDVWAFSVIDEGEGIAAEHIPRLTERFYRIDSGRSRQMGGTGLGLAIVKHIVNRHRGRLVITSREGVGTTMTVLLPALD